jgi:hypothetical protein
MQACSVVEGMIMAGLYADRCVPAARDRYVADLYVWVQVNDSTKASFVTDNLSAHRPLVDGLVANLRAAPPSDMDTNWLLI